MFAPSYFGKLLECKSHTLKQPKAVEFAFKAICSRFGHFSAESDWITNLTQSISCAASVIFTLKLNLGVILDLLTLIRTQIFNELVRLSNSDVK